MLKQLLDGVVNAMEVFDSLDDRTDLPLDTVEFLLSAFVVALAHSIQPVQLAVILGGKFLGELPGHQMARSAWARIAMVGHDGSGDFAAQHSIDKKQMA